MRFFTALVAAAAIATLPAPALADTGGHANWQNDLAPIGATDWNYDFAAHLLERAGFGGTPEEIQALAKMTPDAGRGSHGSLRGRRYGRPAALRSIRNPRSWAGAVSAQPPGRYG